MKAPEDRYAKTCLLSLLILLILGGAASTTVAGQGFPAAGAVEGFVLAKGAREPVPFAIIREKNLGLETQTDELGAFRLDNVLPGERTIHVILESGREYSMKATVRENETTHIKWYVHADAFLTDEVVVVGEKATEGMSRHSLSKEEMTGIPGNNNDPIRAVENLPGVAGGGGGFGGSEGLIIRGTSPEDSNYLVNGFEVPQLFHFGVLVSVINPELIETIDYMPGSYGVRYSDALGGIIEVKTRDAHRDRFGGVVDLATYSSFVMFEGPFGEKTSGAAAIRRSFIDFFLPYVIPEDQAELTLAPRFYDYLAVFNYQIDTKNSLKTTFMGSDDGMELLADSDDNDNYEESMTFKMSNYFHRGDVDWLTCPNQRLSNRLTFSLLYSAQDQSFGSMASFQRKVLTPALRDELSFSPGESNELRLGFEGRVESTEISSKMNRPPKEGQTGGQDGGGGRFELNEEFAPVVAGLYAEDAVKPWPWFQIIPGFRYDYHSYLGEYSIDPRLNANFFPTKKATIKAAAGQYHQWPASDEMMENIGAKDLEAESGILGALGFDYRFDAGYSAELQGYYKSLDNLVSPTNDPRGEPYENSGIGFVYGLEILGRKQLTDRLFGWASYTYSVSKRKDSNDDDWRYFDQDQTHNFIILASYMLGQNKQWKIGAKWQYYTGMPYTEILGGVYDADANRYEPVYASEVNGKREGDYHQLDVRVDKLWTFNRWTMNTYLDVQNVYWSTDPAGYRYNYDYSEKEDVSFQSFMPTIGIQARF